jgi:hypothetical protein
MYYILDVTRQIYSYTNGNHYYKPVKYVPVALVLPHKPILPTLWIDDRL